MLKENNTKMWLKIFILVMLILIKFENFQTYCMIINYVNYLTMNCLKYNTKSKLNFIFKWQVPF